MDLKITQLLFKVQQATMNKYIEWTILELTNQKLTQAKVARFDGRCHVLTSNWTKYIEVL